MSTTFSVYVENKFWVLAKISRLFSQHMFNIKTLTVAPTIDKQISCMTIDVEESEERLNRMELTLNKLPNVLAVHICDEQNYIETEMVLVKIKKSNPNFAKFIDNIKNYDARTIYRHDNMEIIEFSGDTKSINSFLKIANENKVESIVRTGPVAMPKIWSISDLKKSR